jgi:serine/threonine-protein kinase
VYVHPATHSTGPTGGGATAIPYGSRLRLRADFPLGDLPSDGARVVAQALQRYGMMLADGGQIAFTAQSDRFTTAKWDGLLDAYDLSSLLVSDFEMVDSGEWFDWTGDCIRNTF